MSTDPRDEQVHRFYVGVDTSDGDRLDVIAETIGHVTENATITHGIGMWHGTREPTTIIEVAGIDDDDAKRLGGQLCWVFSQECVLHTVSTQRVRLLSKGVG